jgi:autotransporter adhesin
VEGKDKRSQYRIGKHMNKVYRTVWNRALEAFVAASENDKGCGKGKDGHAVGLQDQRVRGAAADTRQHGSAVRSIAAAAMMLLGVGVATQSAHAQYAVDGGTASGGNTISIGPSSTASGEYGTAIGLSSTASGTSSIAMGPDSTASLIYGVAIGNLAQATGAGAIALAAGAAASGNEAVALGFNGVSSGSF